jgi:hypothetical protein
MRRLLQIAATLVITLLALQPALDGLACSLSMGPACPMGMGTMSPDCPMAQQTAQAGCPDCRNHALPQSAVMTAILIKPKSGATSPMIATVAEPLPVQAASAAGYMPAASSSPPPLYVLNQVFRI